MEVQDSRIHSESFHGLDPNSVLHGELDVQVVDYVSQLLRAQYSTIHGLLPPSHLYGLERASQSTLKIPQNVFAVQIHIIPGHYLVSTQINGCVILIDSLYHWSHRNAVMGQLEILYEENPITNVRYICPQSQGASNLCGFFSIAFVHSLILKRRAPHERFEMSLMRQHLRRCLTDGIMLPFPLVGEIQEQKQTDTDLLYTYFCHQKKMNENKTTSANVQTNSNSNDNSNKPHDKNRNSVNQKDKFNYRKSKIDTKQVKVCGLKESINKGSQEKCQQHGTHMSEQNKRKITPVSNETSKCKRQMFCKCTDHLQTEIMDKSQSKRQNRNTDTANDRTNQYDKTSRQQQKGDKRSSQAMNKTKTVKVNDLINKKSKNVLSSHENCQQLGSHVNEQTKRKGTSVPNETSKCKRQMYDACTDQLRNKISGKKLTKREKYKLKLEQQKIQKQQKKVNDKHSVDSATSLDRHVKNDTKENTKENDCEVLPATKINKIQTANKIRKRNSRRNLSEIDKNKLRHKNKLDHRTSRSAMSVNDKNKLRHKNKQDHRTRRSAMSENNKNKLRHKNKHDHRRSRSAMSENEILQQRDKNKLEQNRSRSALSENDKNKLRHKNKQDHRTSSSALSENDKSELRLKNKHDHRRSRSAMSENEILQQRDKNKLEQNRSRSAMSENEKNKLRHKNKHDHRRSRSALSENEILQQRDKNKLEQNRSRSAMSKNEKNQQRDKNKEEHIKRRKTQKEQTEELFESYHTNSSPSHEAVYHILEVFFQSIKEGPIFNCCSCNRYMYRSSVKKLNVKLRMAAAKICNFHLNNTDDETVWICDTCSSNIQKKKLPSRAVSNNLTVDKVPVELQNMSHLEKQLVGKIIPFMKIVSLPAGSQHGLKGKVVLVPANIQKTVTSLPHQTGESQIIALSLKRRLSDKYGTTKQYIRPNIVNQAFRCLKAVNSHYEDIPFNENWITESEANDEQLWKCVSEENTTVHDISQDSNACSSDIEINEANENTVSNSDDAPFCEGDNKQLEKSNEDQITDSEDEVDYSNPVDIVEDITYKRSMNSITCIYPEFGPSLRSDKVLNLAPGEGQVPVSALFEKDWETLAFPTLYPTGKDTFHQKREVQVSPKKYVIARLLSKESRFAEGAEYTFQCLHWIESVAVNDSISISLKKSRQSDLTAGQIQNPDKLKSLFKDDEIYASFKKIRGTPQYWKDMQQNMLAKIRHFGTYTFFLSGSAADFHWPELIQIVAKQYGENYDIDYIEKEMDKKTKRNWLARNPVTTARHIDYIFHKLWGNVILSGIHPVGQILNYDIRKEMQNRGTAHFHSAIHVQNAPLIDKNTDEEIVLFVYLFYFVGFNVAPTQL